jgi:prophage DNA circulation protein
VKNGSYVKGHKTKKMRQKRSVEWDSCTDLYEVAAETRVGGAVQRMMMAKAQAKEQSTKTARYGKELTTYKNLFKQIKNADVALK